MTDIHYVDSLVEYRKTHEGAEAVLSDCPTRHRTLWTSFRCLERRLKAGHPHDWGGYARYEWGFVAQYRNGDTLPLAIAGILRYDDVSSIRLTMTMPMKSVT